MAGAHEGHSGSASKEQTDEDNVAHKIHVKLDRSDNPRPASSPKPNSERRFQCLPIFTQRDSPSRWSKSSVSKADHLTFYQKYFTTLVVEKQGDGTDTPLGSSDFSTDDKTTQRRFSWRARGTIIALVSGSLVTIAIIVNAVVLSTKRVKPVQESYINAGDTFRPTIQSPSGRNDTQLAFKYSDPPVRLGILTNFPDPSIYYDNRTRTWFAVGSNDGSGVIDSPSDGPLSRPAQYSRSNIQIATSHDFNQWTLLNYQHDPLPSPGAWVKQGTSDDPPSKAANITYLQTATPAPNVPPSLKQIEVDVPKANVWAPELFHNPNTNAYILYYSAECADYHHHCIGAASASTPQGPYTAQPTQLACPIPQGGAIDPAAFLDPDTSDVYVAYKIDGNSMGAGGMCGNTVPGADGQLVPTPIMLQRMQPDGLTPASSPPVTLLERTDADGPLIEAPSLVKVGGVYYLFFSSGCTRDASYNVKYATATAVTGPYTRAAETLLKTGDYNLTAPGSATVRRALSTFGGAEVSSGVDTDWKIALHARVHVKMGGIRVFFTSGLAFDPAARTVRLVDGSAPT